MTFYLSLFKLPKKKLSYCWFRFLGQSTSLNFVIDLIAKIAKVKWTLK